MFSDNPYNVKTSGVNNARAAFLSWIFEFFVFLWSFSIKTPEVFILKFFSFSIFQISNV